MSIVALKNEATDYLNELSNFLDSHKHLNLENDKRLFLEKLKYFMIYFAVTAKFGRSINEPLTKSETEKATKLVNIMTELLKFADETQTEDELEDYLYQLKYDLLKDSHNFTLVSNEATAIPSTNTAESKSSKDAPQTNNTHNMFQKLFIKSIDSYNAVRHTLKNNKTSSSKENEINSAAFKLAAQAATFNLTYSIITLQQPIIHDPSKAPDFPNIAQIDREDAWWKTISNRIFSPIKRILNYIEQHPLKAIGFFLGGTVLTAAAGFFFPLPLIGAAIGTIYVIASAAIAIKSKINKYFFKKKINNYLYDEWMNNCNEEMAAGNTHMKATLLVNQDQYYNSSNSTITILSEFNTTAITITTTPAPLNPPKLPLLATQPTPAPPSISSQATSTKPPTAHAPKR